MIISESQNIIVATCLWRIRYLLSPLELSSGDSKLCKESSLFSFPEVFLHLPAPLQSKLLMISAITQYSSAFYWERARNRRNCLDWNYFLAVTYNYIINPELPSLKSHMCITCQNLIRIQEQDIPVPHAFEEPGAASWGWFFTFTLCKI